MGLADVAVTMASQVRHRGPDDADVWVDSSVGVALGHRRLAIIDTSAAGHQPMHSASGRYVIVFNGEIYNHLELRRTLTVSGMAPAWRGHSDTETLLACVDAWGLERALQACLGMFALALWDRRDREIALARDRFGEKPLYYGWHGNAFIFGSELKALTVHPKFQREIDRDAVALFMRYGYIPTPRSIWKGIRKLSPSTILRTGIGGRGAEPAEYWSLEQAIESGRRDPFDGSAEDAATEFEHRLRTSVRGQMLSDVPLGALLSGGIDSSTIVALMQAQSDVPIHTYSIGFLDAAYDESAFAAEIARHLGTRHTELLMTSEDVIASIPRMPQIYDEPFADSSQLPTSLVMSLARQHVTVALTGDGGDELFGGYSRYAMLPLVWGGLRRTPYALRNLAARLLRGVSIDGWNRILQPVTRHLGSRLLVGDKLHKLAEHLCDVRSMDQLHLALSAAWTDTQILVPGSQAATVLLNTPSDWPEAADPVSRIMALDALTYMTDDILVKVDRAAMAASLETRAPFLDHRVAEFAWRLPLRYKIAGNLGKKVVRDVLQRFVPMALFDRPKQGFAIPVDRWLRNELRDWAEALLAPEAIRAAGFLDERMVSLTWQQHLAGSRDFGVRLWAVLMLQTWLQHQNLSDSVESRDLRIRVASQGGLAA